MGFDKETEEAFEEMIKQGEEFAKEVESKGLFAELERQLEVLNEDKIEDKSAFEMTEELNRIKTQRESKVKADELLQELYLKTAENIRKSESLRTEINKDSFDDKDKIIDTLLYTVGLLAKDDLFYQTNILKLKGYKPKYKVWYQFDSKVDDKLTASWYQIVWQWFDSFDTFL